MTAKQIIWLAAILIPACGNCRAAQTEEDFFTPDVIQDIRLRIHPADWERLKTDYKQNTYYPADFQWRDMVLPSVGIRSAGLGTRSAIKPAMRIDFDHFEEQEFLGLKSVRLKNNAHDASMLKERLVMLFYRRMGIPAPRTAHARLYINGAYAGLYLLCESIDKHFLERNFGDNLGDLYKYEYDGAYRFEYRGPDPARYSPRPFEPHTHEKDPDPVPLVAMIRAINETPDADFAALGGEFVDLSAFLDQVAVEVFFAEEDGILADHGMANFYLYRFANHNLHRFLVWDKDKTFGESNRSIWRNTEENVLSRRALAAPGMRSVYLEAFLKSAALAGGRGGWLEQEIARQYHQIREDVYADPNKQCPPGPWHDPRGCSNDQFEKEVTRITGFARARSAFVRKELAEAGFEIPTGSAKLKDGATLAPGSVITLFGEGLAISETKASLFPLPITLGGVTVLIDGTPAPLLMVSPDQVNLQVPWEISPGAVSLTALVNGASSSTVEARVDWTAPRVLAITDLDGREVSQKRPAEPGETLLVFATGLGPVTRGAATAMAAPADPAGATKATPVVTIGGVAAEVLSSILAPGLAGVYEVRVVAPEGRAKGADAALVISAGGRDSAPKPIAR